MCECVCVCVTYYYIIKHEDGRSYIVLLHIDFFVVDYVERVHLSRKRRKSFRVVRNTPLEHCKQIGVSVQYYVMLNC